jgi:spermidine synthase
VSCPSLCGEGGASRDVGPDEGSSGPNSSPDFLLLALSAGSGVAALIYEIVWFQFLELVIGSSAVSLGVLLATFMGGTCLGSLLFPRVVSVRLNPLRVYAAIEIGIGAFGLFMLFLIPLAGHVYASWSGYGLGGFLLRGIVAALCLLPPTLLMGATLPALSRRLKAAPGAVSWLGLFYTANILGAVFGCLLAGFYLLRQYDVFTATFLAAALNCAVAGIAFLLAGSPVQIDEGRVPEERRRERKPRSVSAVYVAIALSGFCALAAETIWTRILGLLLGASVYTFSIILAVFLVGLAIGSSIASLLCRSLASPRTALGWCQLCAGGAIAWTAYNLNASLPYWPIDPSISSSIWFNFQFDLDRTLWALFPPTVLWGASFPFALAAAPPSDDAATPMSRVYGANTLGAIAGALAASWILTASVGSQRTQQLLIAVSVISGLLLLLYRSSWRGRIAALAASLVFGLFLYEVPPISKLLIAHGRYAATWVDRGDIAYAEEGLNASVAVSNFPDGVRSFHVAGKIQASNVPRDMRLQRMLGHLTSLIPATPRSVLVIGCGAGITAGAVSIDPRVERVTIVEIEPLVPKAAAAYFSHENFNVVENPRVQLRIDDGRHYLLTTADRFDAITADPLDPWVKGAANLYTKEFFEAVKSRLNPGGVVTVYIQLFETTNDAVKSAVATFFEVFPNGTIWGNTHEGKGHDMVLLGQAEPLRIDLDELERRLKRPEYARVVRSLHDVGMESSLDLFTTYAGRRADLGDWLNGAAINRDQNLRMQYLAGFGLNLDDSAQIYADLLAHRRFPDTLFISAEGRVERLRQAF